MHIIIASVLILFLTCLVWSINRHTSVKLCPLCVGVSGTWIFLTVLVLSGIIEIEPWRPAISMLMGGSIIGIGYQGEKRFPALAGRMMQFRLPIAVIGFPLAYAGIQFMSWSTLIIELILLSVVMYIYFLSPTHVQNNTTSKEAAKKIEALEEKMKNCC